MPNFKLSGNAFEPHATKLYESSNVINVGRTERIVSLAAGVLLYSLSAKGNQNLLKKNSTLWKHVLFVQGYFR
jgi:hypothetical protein